LDNGIRSSTAARRVQQIADTLTADKIGAVFRKWLRRLPQPFAPAHRAAGYRYRLSILQSEFALAGATNRGLFPATGTIARLQGQSQGQSLSLNPLEAVYLHGR
jgi:hypothetical protein